MAEMGWSELQKMFPSYTSRYKDQFLALFSVIGKNSLSSEDIDKVLSGEIDISIPPPKYEMTYTTWEGTQRLREIPQLVLQVNKGASISEILSADPKLVTFFNKVVDISFASGHPVVKDETLGWFRLDFLSKNLLLVDEIQSDALKMVWVLKVSDDPEHHALRETLGKEYTDEEVSSYAEKFISIFKDWHNEALSTLLQIARDHQVKEVGIHTQESMNLKGAGSVWVKSIYEKVAKDFGFTEQNRKVKNKNVSLFVKEANKLSYSISDLV